MITPEFLWFGSQSPAAELRAESPEPFPESEPEAWYEVTRCKPPWGRKVGSWTEPSDSLDSVRIIDGILEGFGGGESGAEFSSFVWKCRRSAQGDKVGSLVILGMVLLPVLPRVLELGDRESRVVQVVLGRECVENLEDGNMLSAPAERVIKGDWMTPSALLHFSWATLFTSDGVRE